MFLKEKWLSGGAGIFIFQIPGLTQETLPVEVVDISSWKICHKPNETAEFPIILKNNTPIDPIFDVEKKTPLPVQENVQVKIKVAKNKRVKKVWLLNPDDNQNPIAAIDRLNPPSADEVEVVEEPENVHLLFPRRNGLRLEVPTR